MPNNWSEALPTYDDLLIGTTCACRQFRAPPRYDDRPQQQRLDAWGEDLIARFAGVLAVAQLVRQTDLLEILVSLLGTVEVGDPNAGSMAIEHVGHHAGVGQCGHA